MRTGIITKEEFERLHSGFSQKGKELEAAMQKQEQLIKDMFKKGALFCGATENVPGLCGVEGDRPAYAEQPCKAD